MKKNLAVMTAVLMMAALAGCGGNEAAETTAAPAAEGTAEAEAAETEAEEPREEAAEETEAADAESAEETEAADAESAEETEAADAEAGKARPMPSTSTRGMPSRAEAAMGSMELTPPASMGIKASIFLPKYWLTMS